MMSETQMRYHRAARMRRYTMNSRQVGSSAMHAAFVFRGVIVAVAQHYGISVNNLMGKTRNREISHPRQVAMHLCREMSNASLPQIGRSFSRDHTTVVHALKAVEKRMDDKLRTDIARIRERMAHSDAPLKTGV